MKYLSGGNNISAQNYESIFNNNSSSKDIKIIIISKYINNKVSYISPSIVTDWRHPKEM